MSFKTENKQEYNSTLEIPRTAESYVDPRGPLTCSMISLISPLKLFSFGMKLDRVLDKVADDRSGAAELLRVLESSSAGNRTAESRNGRLSEICSLG